MKMPATNWTDYYASGVPWYTAATRKLSALKISRLVRARFGTRSLSICELGGANSCFLDEFLRFFLVHRYHVIDSNVFGLDLLVQRDLEPSVTWELADVLDDAGSDAQFDLVFSVGLVEHFDQKGTSRAIAAHFERCKPGGTVLITFPTPTIPYRLIRALAERLGAWDFPDERPLDFDEVQSVCRDYGTVTHTSINWLIGLTQGYVAVTKDHDK